VQKDWLEIAMSGGKRYVCTHKCISELSVACFMKLYQLLTLYSVEISMIG
jgi:hypothetical protein